MRFQSQNAFLSRSAPLCAAVVAFSFRIICKKVLALCIKFCLCISVHTRRAQQHATIISQPSLTYTENSIAKCRKFFFANNWKTKDNQASYVVYICIYIYYKEKFKKFLQYVSSLLIVKRDRQIDEFVYIINFSLYFHVIIYFVNPFSDYWHKFTRYYYAKI